MIAPTSAIAQGRARGDACPTMVSTISSAPPESASNLANIAPNAIRMPTPAAVEPNPSAKDLSTFCRSSPATMPTVNAPKISARNGCSLTTVIKTTITAIPARKARISCQPDATGSASLGASSARIVIASPIMKVISSPVRWSESNSSRRRRRCPDRRRRRRRVHPLRAARGCRTGMPAERPA